MTIPMGSSLADWFLTLVLIFIFQTTASAHESAYDETSAPAIAQYIANAGVMISDENVKIIFDPLFNNTFGQFQPLPANTKSALLNGKAPFDNIDAVMISHQHDDHFDANDMLTLLRNCKQLQVYAPTQAVSAMRGVAAESDADLFERVTPLNIKYKDKPHTINVENTLIEVVHIPHSGWPTHFEDLQNLSYRVTLNNSVTVTHMGDADINQAHFSNYEKYWSARQTDMAFPPYWYLLSKDGRRILNDHVHAKTSVGIHVPEKIPQTPEARPPEYRGMDLFTTPGETREIINKSQ